VTQATVAIAARSICLSLSERLRLSYSRQKLASSLIESANLSNENYSDRGSVSPSDQSKSCIMALDFLVYGRQPVWRGRTQLDSITAGDRAFRVNADWKDGEVKRPPTRNWREIAIVCLLGSALFYVFSRTSADPDLWGHVRFGQDLWQPGRIVREDIYSYLTGDQLWINHEWLSEVIFYFAFATARPAGLIAFKSGLALLILGFLYWHLRQQIAVASHAAILTGVFC
jgi:hypothetical protein